MSIKLPELQFEKNALEPYISAKTLEFHYGKHHQGYIDKTNQAIKGTDMEGHDLKMIVNETSLNPDQKELFNNAAQAWNHSFFWECLKPGGGGNPSGKIAERINADLGGFDQFAENFKKAGTTQFGSGWAWLAHKDGKLSVLQSANAANPLAEGYQPLLVVDVWEHAYYLDYQNRRADFLQNFIDHLINWDFVNEQLD